MTSGYIGMRFGKLTVVGIDSEFYVSPSGRKHRKAICMCDCGNNATILVDNLKRTKSCGCAHLQQVTELGKRNTKHGGRNERLYRIWAGMKQRCENSSTEQFKYYGGRGIKICDEWKHNYEAFRSWSLANGYSDDLSIDRIDVNSDYQPSNCRWATNIEQQNNLSTNRIISVDGELVTVAQACRKYDIPHHMLLRRINKGLSGDEAIKEVLSL